MGFLGWTAAIGVLLLLVSFTSGWIRRLPVTTFAIYLVAGIAAGPWGLDLVDIHVPGNTQWLTNASDIALVISLFITGLKLRLTLNDSRWLTMLQLAFPAMVLTIAAMAAVAHVMVGLSWPLALALGAIVAPTDPVLASLVAVNDARDDDGMRLALSGEAGLNDGLALPFLMLALLLIDGKPLDGVIGHWALVGLLWYIVAGACIGLVTGWLIGLVGVRLRRVTVSLAPSDFLALGLMAIAYSAAEAAHGSGFLAAFAAGVGLRQAELMVVRDHPYSKWDNTHDADAQHHPPAEMLVDRRQLHGNDTLEPAASVGLMVSDAISFGDTLERLISAGTVFLIGLVLANYWSPNGLLLGAVLFVVIRPVSVYLCTIGGGLPRPRRLLMGWLGIRGIGGLNYLLYAESHGISGYGAHLMSAIALTIVAASILVHGITAPPLMSWRQRKLDEQKAEAD